jgi:hypothetical protein
MLLYLKYEYWTEPHPLCAKIVPRSVATCCPATIFGMKFPLKWPLEKLRRLRQSHEDPKTRVHVKEALQQDVVTSEVHGWLKRPETEDLGSLSMLTPQDSRNEAPPTTALGMSETVVADVENASNYSQRVQTSSSKADIPSFYIAGSTRISSPMTDGSPHDVKHSEIPLSSPIYGLPRSQEELERSDSPTLIQRFSPDGHMAILLNLSDESDRGEAMSGMQDLPESLPEEQGNLGPFYDKVFHPVPNLENPSQSVSILRTDDHHKLSLHMLHHPEPNSDQQGYPELLQEGQSHSKSISDRQSHEKLVSDVPCHSVFTPERPKPESVISGAQDKSEPTSHGPDQLDSVSDQKEYPEPKWEEHDQAACNSGQQGHPESILERPDHQVPVLVRPELSKSILEGDSHSQPISAAHRQEEFISKRQSGPESLKSHKSIMVKDQQRRLRQEAKLHNLLSRNLQTKARAYEKRSQLRQSRSEISNVDEAFMKLIRERRVQDNQDDLALEASFKKLQDARDRYGPLEEAYNALEEQVNREEYETKELEEKMLKFEITAPDFDINSLSSDEDSEAPHAIREPGDPLYEEYMSRLGDADLCREALSDLMFEHENLLHAQEKMGRVGRDLLPDDQMTLENFPVAEAKLRDELGRIEADVEHLRLQCIREGLFSEEQNEDEEGGEEIDLSQFSTGLVDAEQAEYNKYRLLLEKPEEREEENKSKVLLTDFNEGDVGDRITCWLLHKLRLSGLEVELLARVADELGRSKDREKWQEEVLEFWFFDSANLPASAYKVEPTFTPFPPPPMTDLIKESHERFGNVYLIQMVVRGPALSEKLEVGMRLKLTQMNGRSVITL